MNYIKLFSSILFFFLLSSNFAQSKPELLIEKLKDSYNLILEIDESKEIKFVTVKGYNFNKVENQNFEYKFANKELFSKKIEQINVHQLDLAAEYIYYTITVEKTDGRIDRLPSKKLTMSSSNIVVSENNE